MPRKSMTKKGGKKVAQASPEKSLKMTEKKLNKPKKQCIAKTGKGDQCKNGVFFVKGDNENKCRLHYLMEIHKEDGPEPPKESAAPVVNGLIWIGSIAATRDADLLKKHGIKGIINASGIEPIPAVMKDYNKLGINYYTFTEYDDEKRTEKFFIDSPFDKYPDFTKKDFFKYVIRGAQIMQNELKQRPCRKPLLINCHAGMNRSASVIAAYLILVGKMSYSKAIKLLEKANATRGLDVLTNPHFRRALKELEQKRHMIPI